MAHNPVGSGSSLTVSTDTAKVIAAGIAQQAKSLRVTLVGASGLEGAHNKTGTMPTATTADFYYKNRPKSAHRPQHMQEPTDHLKWMKQITMTMIMECSFQKNK